MNSVLSKIVSFSKQYPMSRGMVAYCAIWPVSSVCQQLISGKEEIDYKQVLRFSFFGSCYVAPTLFVWLKLANAMWPTMNLRTAMVKALVEQISYGPAAVVSFFFGMSLLEGKPVSESAAEVRAKFLPTYQVGVVVWPVLQTINYTLIKERNRVPYVGACSLLWTSFLSYMKSLETEKLKAEQISLQIQL